MRCLPGHVTLEAQQTRGVRTSTVNINSSIPPLDQRRVTLSSGLRLITVRLPHLHVGVATMHLRVGSRFESEHLNGISHFLEHMLYRGTPRCPTAHAQALAFESLGGTLDAATSLDHGSMSIAVPPENLEPAMQLMSEVYREPLFADLELERGIVREEILESYDDRGHLVAPDLLLGEEAFGTHPLGFPITGTTQHLERFDEATLRIHHAKHYVAEGTVLTVAGPIDHDRVRRWAERDFATIGHGAVPESESPPMPSGAPRLRYARHSMSQTALRVAFRAPGERDPEEAVFDVLMRILDDGLSTRLYHRLCDELGLCYDVAATYEAYDDCGLVELAAETEHSKAVDVATELLDVARRLRDDGPSEAELERAKARHRWQLLEMFDSAESVASLAGLRELSGLVQSPQERHERILDVSRANIMDAAARWFSRDSLTVIAVGRLSKRDQNTLLGLLNRFQ